MGRLFQRVKQQGTKAGETSRDATVGRAGRAAKQEMQSPRAPFTYGNQGMQQILRRGILQAKLAVNQPGDAYEQEADRVASAVMNLDASLTSTVAEGPAPARVQRACACGGACEDCQRKAPDVQRVNAGSAAGAGAAPPIVQDVVRSAGQPLAAGLRGFFEPRFGADFSGVRVHTDSRAGESARAVDARAYTLGQNIVFGAGQFAPGTAAGKSLLAHELTHVLQQSRSNLFESHFLQRTPDKDKEKEKGKGEAKKDEKKGAKDPVADCLPAEGTLAEVTASPDVSALSMGNTKPAKIAFDFGNQFKDGVCSAKMSKAVLSFERFISVKAGTFKLGTSTPPEPPCKDKNLDVFITITPPMAKQIREGEIEHCHDAHRAFDLTYAKYNAAAKVLEAGFPAKDKAECNAETLARLKKATGIEISKWKSVADCLFDKTHERDTNGWHTVDPGDPVFAKDCKSATYTPDAKKTLTKLGKPSAEIVKGCGEP